MTHLCSLKLEEKTAKPHVASESVESVIQVSQELEVAYGRI